jgi:phosphohistidine phosphatase
MGKKGMKKTLLILRHAKSSWKNINLSDRDRPLNGRGKRDAPTMGKRLKKLGYHADLILSSPAVRAAETARRVAIEIGYEDKIIMDEALYMAGVDEYIEVIAGIGESINHLMLVSHNPGSEELLSFLTCEVVEKFPTAAYALMEIEGSWSDLSKGKLLCFDYPKSREEA